MKTNNSCERKNMGDLKKDIMDTANTSKEIVQDKFHNVKMGARNTVNMVDENIKGAKRKVVNASADIKKGSNKVAKDVQKTAAKVSRTVTSPSKKDK